MRPLSVAALLLLVAITSPAAAVAPCFDSCHLAQGQPLLLADRKQLWVRRCDTAADGKGACVAQRVDMAGKVLAERTVPAIQDREFEKVELGGRTVVRLGWQSAWTDLTRPYALDLAGRTAKLAIERDALVCSPPGLPSARRPLGCAARTMHVFAATTRRYGAVVVMAACAVDGGGEREVVATCETGGEAG